jgi:hypothetical protein
VRVPAPAGLILRPQPLELAPPDERDHLAVERAQLAELAPLAVGERGVHLGALDVQPRLREVEVRRHRLDQPAVLVVGEREGARLVLPRQAGGIEQLGELPLRVVREPRWVFPPEMPELHGYLLPRPTG